MYAVMCFEIMYQFSKYHKDKDIKILHTKATRILLNGNKLHC